MGGKEKKKNNIEHISKCSISKLVGLGFEHALYLNGEISVYQCHCYEGACLVLSTVGLSEVLSHALILQRMHSRAAGTEELWA